MMYNSFNGEITPFILQFLTTAIVAFIFALYYGYRSYGSNNLFLKRFFILSCIGSVGSSLFSVPFFFTTNGTILTISVIAGLMSIQFLQLFVARFTKHFEIIPSKLYKILLFSWLPIFVASAFTDIIATATQGIIMDNGEFAWRGGISAAILASFSTMVYVPMAYVMVRSAKGVPKRRIRITYYLFSAFLVSSTIGTFGEILVHTDLGESSVQAIRTVLNLATGLVAVIIAIVSEIAYRSSGNENDTLDTISE